MTTLKSVALAATFLLPTAALADWSGYYAGGSIGTATNLSYDITTDIDPDVDFDDAGAFGIFFGTRTETNGVVLGGEFAAEFLSDAETDDGEVFIDLILDFKFTAGVPAGDALFYGILSASSINGEYGPNDINAAGIGYGAGAAYKFNDAFSVGAEYIVREGTAEFVETDVDATADTFTLRGAFHF